MTLDTERIREMFWMLGIILPIEGTQNKAAIESMLGHNLSEVLPDLMQGIAQLCMAYPDQFDGYLKFFQEAIAYMRKERDEKPTIDYSQSRYNKFELERFMAIQLGKYREFKEEQDAKNS